MKTATQPSFIFNRSPGSLEFNS